VIATDWSGREGKKIIQCCALGTYPESWRTFESEKKYSLRWGEFFSEYTERTYTMWMEVRLLSKLTCLLPWQANCTFLFFIANSYFSLLAKFSIGYFINKSSHSLCKGWLDLTLAINFHVKDTVWKLCGISGYSSYCKRRSLSLNSFTSIQNIFHKI